MDSLRRIAAIAANTYRESVRDKILYNIVFLAIGLSVFSVVLGAWSVFDRALVIKSTTISLMSLSGLLIAVFVGISLIQKEIQRRTVFTLLSKPMRRPEFLLGKYLGLLALMATHLILLTGVFYFILWVTGSGPELGLLRAVYLVFWELAILVAVAMLFSSFSTPVLSSLFTLGIYVAGHLTDQLLAQVRFVQNLAEGGIGQQHAALMETAALWAQRLLPELYRYNISHQVVHHLTLSPGYMLFSTLYAIGYIVILLGIAAWWFDRRDFL
ncbi:MAG TPA: ABC transporter permease [Fibrobacteraceae bacterium]|nr:ABC transporter permease [Fibrobacteraceae bacterium]